MFDRLFKRTKKPAPPQDDWEAKLVWLPVGHPENPFREEVLDCRAVALSFYSTTSDKSVAESFGRLRVSDGQESRGRLPEQAIETDCELRFPYDGNRNDGPISVAREMEDKWDFYAYDSRLYVRRSWTGQLTHVAELEYSPNAVVVRHIHCEPNTVFGDRHFAVAQLHFLITTHMGRTLIPFPIPPDSPRTPAKSIALMGFATYGRRSQFASYVRQTPNPA
ncbi:MAG: hypothetical protein HY301_00110 [Verrucomicrobia bacterium]|nr:hypothetical protein [Verrucomicrobiota bacterium]